MREVKQHQTQKQRERGHKKEETNPKSEAPRDRDSAKGKEGGSAPWLSCLPAPGAQTPAGERQPPPSEHGAHKAVNATFWQTKLLKTLHVVPSSTESSWGSVQFSI